MACWRRKTPSSAFEKEQDIAKQGKYWEDRHDGHERMRAADNWDERRLDDIYI